MSFEFISKRSFLARAVVFLVGAAACAVVVSAGPGHAKSGQHSLRFAIERDGLNFTGPCGALLYRIDDKKFGADTVVQNVVDIQGANLDLDAGRYHALVRCPSTEGVLSQVYEVDLRKKDQDVVGRMVPGFVQVGLVRNASEVSGEVRIRDGHGRVVAEGATRAPLPVPPGTLTVEATGVAKYGRKSLSLTTEATAKVKAQQKTKVDLDISDGDVVITVRENGKRADALASLMMPGTEDRAFELDLEGPTKVPPGTYDVVTQLETSHDFRKDRKRKVEVKSKRTTKLVIDHATGSIAPKAMLDGKPLAIGENGERVDVLLFLGAAPKEFNILDGGEVARLSPGKYRVMIRRKKALDDKSAWAGESAVTVTKGSKRDVVVDLTPATWTLSTQVGGKPHEMDLEVFAESGEAPLLKRTTPAADDATKENPAGTTTLRLPDGIYRAVATLSLPQGPVTKQTRVVLRRGKTERTTFDIHLGVATVQVIDKGMAVPAEVAFYAAGTAAPTLTIKAGKDAMLPPGRYTLTVTRKGVTKAFGEIAVNEERPIERTLDFTAAPAQ